VQVRPSPDPGVDDVRKALTAGDLETPVQGALNRDASGKGRKRVCTQTDANRSTCQLRLNRLEEI
jgi:hypothetical protein